MLKNLQPKLLGVVVASIVLLVGCIPGDPLPEDLYTKNVYPGINNTYDIGSPEYSYEEGYFRTVYVDSLDVGSIILSDAFPITLTGDARVWVEFHPDLDFSTILANAKPTYATRGIFGGFSLPVFVADDEELYFDIYIPSRWYQPAWTNLGVVGDRPGGMAVYEDVLYIPCEGDDNVWQYNGTDLSISGTVGTDPHYACVYDGDLYVSCGGVDDDIWVYDGSTWAKSGDVGNNPRGMATYGGSLYVACNGDDTVWVLSGGAWALSGNVGTSPEYLAEFGTDLYVGCGGADDDIWIYNGLVWAKDADVGNEPKELHEHDGKLYANFYNDDTVWARTAGVWGVVTNIAGTLGNQPVGLEEYNGNLFSACQNDIWSNISAFWNLNVDFPVDEPMFLKEYNGRLYSSCYDNDDVWVYGGETAWVHIVCWSPSLQGAATDAFRLYVEYENFTPGIDRVPATGDDIVVEEVTGVTATYQSYLIDIPLNMAGVAGGDNMAFVLQRSASSDEIAGEVVIESFGLVLLCDQIGTPDP